MIIVYYSKTVIMTVKRQRRNKMEKKRKPYMSIYFSDDTMITLDYLKDRYPDTSISSIIRQALESYKKEIK
jgi:hypothetical protein